MRLTKVNLMILTTLLISIIAVSSMVHAVKQGSQYRSYTKTIKTCVSTGNCVMKDLVVQCLGNDVIDIKVVGESMDVPKDYEIDEKFSWCD